MPEKILFLDRDGTLIKEPPDCQVDRLQKIELLPNVISSLARLADQGFRFVMVTNQDGLGTTSFPQDAFEVCQDYILELFRSQGIIFDEVFVCPHLPQDGCDCRKPKTGLLTRYLTRTNIDDCASAVVGDRDSDMQLAENIGLRGIRIANGVSWPDIANRLAAQGRQGRFERTSKETSIRASVDLDSPGPIRIRTGIGFFDHMLEQIAKHGGFSLQLDCDGDLGVDEHHTVEDTAICVGTAIREALGSKRGIDRYGFLLPMDESSAQVALDLSGRAYSAFEGDFPRDAVGELPTELVPHFFHSLAESLGATLHIAVKGENTHHMVEACFKSVGRTLRQAIRCDGYELPSTKGLLN